MTAALLSALIPMFLAFAIGIAWTTHNDKYWLL